MCGSALGLTFLLVTTTASAFEPMPPIMQKLLEVFPEENGRFVDEPFGSTSEMPAEARPLFETFRVVVPGPDDIEKNLARLFAASSHFPIKKITRYDKDPGAPGLVGFRGIWCQTEDESQVGFSIVTINQNRFLIWAKIGYYPAFANDSINPKVRDQYARDVSQYLAGIDLKVPDNEAPLASGRGLQEWMGLYRSPTTDQWAGYTTSVKPVLERDQEINAWGISGIVALKPTQATLTRIIETAPDTVVCDHDPEFLQSDLNRLVSGEHESRIVPISLSGLDLSSGLDHSFAIDRYGRVRLLGMPGEGEVGVQIECLFPGVCITAVGLVSAARDPGESAMKPHTPLFVATYPSRYFFSMAYDSPTKTIQAANDLQLRCLGHLLRVLRTLTYPIDDVLISKPMW